MSERLDNETWIVEAGDRVIVKALAEGRENLTSLERLIYCLWVADCGMCNAGDLAASVDVYEPFQIEAVETAKTLDLPHTQAAFELPVEELEGRYFDLRDGICDEIRSFAAGDMVGDKT